MSHTVRNIVTLNVGGTKMQTYKSILETLPYFESYMDRWSENHPEIFVDYDPNLFIHLLNKLRDANYIMPVNENVSIMCDYFGYVLPDITPAKLVHTTITEVLAQNNLFHHDYDGEKTASYDINTEKKPLHAFALKLRNIYSVSHIRISNRADYIYDIRTEKFPIYFQQQNGTDCWYLKKDFMDSLQNINSLHIEVRGKYDDIFVYVKD